MWKIFRTDGTTVTGRMRPPGVRAGSLVGLLVGLPVGLLAGLTGLTTPLAATEQVSTEAGAPPRAATSADTVALTLEDAEDRALSSNPTLRAARRREAVAEGELRQAEVYRYNPRVEFEAEAVDPEPDADIVDRYEGVVAQEVEWAGQWGLRQDAARHGVRVAAAGATDVERRTLLRARNAYFAVAAARRRSEVAAEMADLTERLRDAVQTQLEEGEVSVLDLNLARIERGRARARMLGAERERESAILELKRVLALSTDTPIRLATEFEPGPGNLPDPGSMDVDSLTAVALERRSDLRGADAAVEEARDLERLARRDAIPNLRLLAPVRQRGTGGSVDIGVGIGLSVPLWNRNQGTRDARKAALLESRDRREAVALRVRTEVRDAVQEYRKASEEERALESSVLGPAGSNLELLEESYRAGKIDLASLLLLQNQLLQAELEYWDAWLAQRRAFARLRAAVGRPTSTDATTDVTGDRP